MGSLKSSINPTPLNACLWAVRGRWITQRDPKQTWVEHACRTGQLVDSNSGPQPVITGAGPDAAQWIMC